MDKTTMKRMERFGGEMEAKSLFLMLIPPVLRDLSLLHPSNVPCFGREQKPGEKTTPARACPFPAHEE